MWVNLNPEAAVQFAWRAGENRPKTAQNRLDRLPGPVPERAPYTSLPHARYRPSGSLISLGFSVPLSDWFAARSPAWPGAIGAAICRPAGPINPPDPFTAEAGIAPHSVMTMVSRAAIRRSARSMRGSRREWSAPCAARLPAPNGGSSHPLPWDGLRNPGLGGSGCATGALIGRFDSFFFAGAQLFIPSRAAEEPPDHAWERLASAAETVARLPWVSSRLVLVVPRGERLLELACTGYPSLARRAPTSRHRRTDARDARIHIGISGRRFCVV